MVMTSDKIMISYPLLKYLCVGGKVTRRAKPFVIKVLASETARWFWASAKPRVEGWPSQR